MYSSFNTALMPMMPWFSLFSINLRSAFSGRPSWLRISVSFNKSGSLSASANAMMYFSSDVLLVAPCACACGGFGYDPA